MASNPSVTLDASFVIGLSAKKPGKYVKAQAELRQRVTGGCSLFAPHLLVMEATFVLCGKLNNGALTLPEHAAALANLHTLLARINFLPAGDSALLARAEQLRQGLGCSRSADGFYIALAEHLATTGPSELLTFDVGQQKQAITRAPTIIATLLTT